MSGPSRAYRASLECRGRFEIAGHANGIACEIRDKNSLYLATGSTGRELLEEHRLRERAGLPGDFLDHAHLLGHFGIARAAAIVSPGAADADPVQLSHELLKTAVARGARLFDAEASEFDAGGHSVCVRLGNGREIEARSVVLATGYVMPDIVQSSVHSVSSSWAIATGRSRKRSGGTAR